MASVTRISSLDPGYTTGDLSLYPTALDTPSQLYQVANNAEATLKQGLTYNAKQIIVDDASLFPQTGLLRLWVPDRPGEPELVYYGSKKGNVFSNLFRGFAGSRQSSWTATVTRISNSVFAEHHNAIKDAMYNIERNVGLETQPAPASLNGLLKALEVRYLSPKPLFRAYPQQGFPGTTVRFQNFSEGGAIRYLWDFGDGSTTNERNPEHTYTQVGIYTVKLNIITAGGAQGVTVKSNYISISNDQKPTFFYVRPYDKQNPSPVAGPPYYSVESGILQGQIATQFEFVDQTDADTRQRYWIFDDGATEVQSDPNVHSTLHTYQSPGIYNPSLLIVFADQTSKRVFLNPSQSVTVS